MRSDLDLAVTWSKRLEALLASRYHANGRGLHEMIDSVKGDLAEPVVRDLRLVATVRNKIVHQEGYDRIDRKAEFLAACRRARRALSPRRARRRWMVLAALAALLAFAVLMLSMGKSPIRLFSMP
jgi:hypothetical protein